jgi:hypothetical protein
VSAAVLEELDIVVLTRDIPAQGLARGDRGTIVHCYDHGHAYEVEFLTAAGETVALITLTGADIRPLDPNEPLPLRR